MNRAREIDRLWFEYENRDTSTPGDPVALAERVCEMVPFGMSRDEVRAYAMEVIEHLRELGADANSDSIQSSLSAGGKPGLWYAGGGQPCARLLRDRAEAADCTQKWTGA